MEASRSCGVLAMASSGLCFPWCTQSVSLPCLRLPSIKKKCGLRWVHRNAVTVFRCVDSRARQESLCDEEDQEVEASDESGSDEEVDLSSLSNEEIDALMKEYGNVVRAEPEAGKQITDDAAADKEGLALFPVVTALAKVASETKADDIKVLHVKPLVYWTRYFLVASAFSMPQMNAIAQRMEDLAEQRFNLKVRGNVKPSSWTLLDFGDVVAHIFLPAEREYYNLEEFYGNAPLVELPFLTETR